MKNLQVISVCGALVLTVTAFAADPAPAQSDHPAATDLNKMGPGARKPTNEAQTRKDLEAFLKKGDELEKSGDFEAMLARIDFPVIMVTDNLKGVPETKVYSKAEYTAMMKPMVGHMPKDLKVSHKFSYNVMSDSLVGVVDAWTMTQGKSRITGHNQTLVVKRDAEWKVKSLVEAGWGSDVPKDAPAPVKETAPATK